MKNVKSFLCIFTVLMASACGQKLSNGPLRNADGSFRDGSPSKPTAMSLNVAGLPNSSTIAITTTDYEIGEGSCSTGQRHWASSEELCTNLQLDINNSGCAAQTRRYIYPSACPQGPGWNPAAAATAWTHKTGFYIACDLKVLTKADQSVTTMHQEAPTTSMRMILGDARADISQSFGGGIYGVTLSLSQPSNGLAQAKATKAFKNAAPDVMTITSESATQQLRLDCTPSIQTLAQ